MNKSRSSQKRVMSASLQSQKRQKPYNQKLQQKRFGRTFTQSYDSDYVVKSNKNRLYTSTTSQMYRTDQKVVKAAEQLVEENNNLKNELNDVNSKLYLTRSKIQSQKKKHLIYAKKLNRQFQKELYWQNEKQNDYLITGVKYQYEKLKQSFQLKCQQLQMIKKTISATQIQEVNSYCEALEIQNKVLIQNITFLKKNKKRSSSNFQDINSSTPKLYNQDFQSLLNQHERRQDKYKNKIKSFESQLLLKSQKQMELTQKVKFLQKLIIQKENDAFHSRKKVKVAERQKSKLLNELKTIESRISDKEKNNSIRLEEVKVRNQRQAQVQKSMLQKVIRQKNNLIQKLQKQIGYLSTLLSYWKPLDELDKIDRVDQNPSQINKTLTLQNQSLSLHTGLSRQLLSKPKATMNSMLSEDNNNDERFLSKSIHNQEFLNRDFSSISINKEEEQQNQHNSKRQPRKSTKKWTQEAKKCRKVQLSEVQEFGELIRYKMISNNISSNGMRDFFSCKIQRSNSSQMEEDLITLKELKETLTAEPFDLSEQDAFVFSRYVIEDQGVEYVYCHQGNELERSIAKSIIKTLVGDYSPPNTEKSQARWRQIKRIYCHNLQLALKSICPKGIISKDKFLEMIKSLGIEIEDQTKDFLVGKLIQKEKSLRTLKYDILFTNEQRIQ